jgi:hypothetical protein
MSEEKGTLDAEAAAWVPWKLLVVLLSLIAIPMLCSAVGDVNGQFGTHGITGYIGAAYFLALVLGPIVLIGLVIARRILGL